MNITIIFSIVGFLVLFFYLLGIIRVILYERKINKTNDDMERKIENIKKEPVSMPIIDRRIAKVREDNAFALERLQRKRQFILDKLPLIKK